MPRRCTLRRSAGGLCRGRHVGARNAAWHCTPHSFSSCRKRMRRARWKKKALWHFPQKYAVSVGAAYFCGNPVPRGDARWGGGYEQRLSSAFGTWGASGTDLHGRYLISHCRLRWRWNRAGVRGRRPGPASAALRVRYAALAMRLEVGANSGAGARTLRRGGCRLRRWPRALDVGANSGAGAGTLKRGGRTAADSCR